MNIDEYYAIQTIICLIEYTNYVIGPLSPRIRGVKSIECVMYDIDEKLFWWRAEKDLLPNHLIQLKQEIEKSLEIIQSEPVDKISDEWIQNNQHFLTELKDLKIYVNQLENELQKFTSCFYENILSIIEIKELQSLFHRYLQSISNVSCTMELYGLCNHKPPLISNGLITNLEEKSHDLEERVKQYQLECQQEQIIVFLELTYYKLLNKIVFITNLLRKFGVLKDIQLTLIKIENW